MVSKRKFFSIVIMMVVLLFLTQFSMVLRDQANQYDANASLSERKADGKEVIEQSKAERKDLSLLISEKSVLFIGDVSGAMGTEVKRWADYVKWDMFSVKSMDEYIQSKTHLPEMIILESEKYAQGEDLDCLERFQKRGAIIVFGCLEDPALIENNEELMHFLGISKVISEKVKLNGVKLFEGLLLGGEQIYETPVKENEKDRQDLTLDVPWYQVGSGTKTYMVGMFKEETSRDIKNEDLPTLIWRNGMYRGSIFAVVGDYLKDGTASGILDGMLTEASEYSIYPIVNAQNLSIVNFPGFADENNAEMMELYSQSVTGVGRDVIWPTLISIVEHSDLKMTCFIQPQADYKDGIEPDSEFLEFYLKQFKEQSAEAGLSMEYKSADSLEEKVDRDGEFFADADSDYRYGAAFAEERDLTDVLNLSEIKLLKNVSTLICEYTEKHPVVSYASDSITLQSVVGDGMHYTYSADLRMRSIQSALGYTNIMLNLQDIFWPQNEKDRWEIMERRFASNLLTYWNKFNCFTATTLSESDRRVRTFLNVDYTESREENVITLNTTKADSWFILRTHGEKIEDIEGGSQTKIEKDAYLIHAEDHTVRIQVDEPGLSYDSRHQ